MVDNLLPDHVGLPHVLDLAVHLVQMMTWLGDFKDSPRFWGFWDVGQGLSKTLSWCPIEY